MDRLDHLLDAAGPLLGRVDGVLSTIGAPEGHDVWAQLRRVRLLPGDAVRAVGALSPDPILDSVAELRADARAYADLADTLPQAGAWTGEAAEAYEKARRATAGHLNGGPDSLGRRMEATADLADALIAWMVRARAAVAAALAGALVSTEALTLTATGESVPADEARAAAAIGAVLLRTVADSYDRAEGLLDDTVPLQTPNLV
ncbi:MULTISPECIES: hypothetical protein [Actinoplanes]|uniref:hypothetical protein n=1 Tax=Actinoplanes TaxID=1865 RepID=UPI0005F29BE7|nr:MULTISPECIES: hypothetical protein [Actinoplanes]GLY05885.1 hypothetical protein Acsp01_62640 [Actinoplanes sp. NBRC 101535]